MQEKIKIDNLNNSLINDIHSNLTQNIIGQDELNQNLIIALLARGHVLLEGMPGLAKTKSAETLANSITANFKRIQFTPDLLPSDLIGGDIYIQDKNQFEFSAGPLFTNIVLADEINRAPAKVQSALLEAMAEKQISVGNNTYKLPELFMVIATQNPIEQEGTYKLPEAQLDRFLLHIKVDYPNAENELKILNQFETKNNLDLKSITAENIISMQYEVDNIYLDAKLKQYIVDLVIATRETSKYSKDLAEYIEHGVSPRASLALCQTAKAFAYLEGESYVNPYHIQKMAKYVLRHRIIASFKAEAENISTDAIIDNIIELVAI